MRTKFVKTLSVLLALTFILAVFPGIDLPAEAASYRTGMNGASTSYMNGAYYEKFLRVPLTGDGITDVLAIALSQTGYQEGDSSSQMSGTVSGSSKGCRLRRQRLSLVRYLCFLGALSSTRFQRYR